MSGAHWRKSWPEGVDNGDDDEAVIGDWGTSKRRPAENPWNPDPTYPWSYDEEVFDTWALNYFGAGFEDEIGAEIGGGRFSLY